MPGNAVATVDGESVSRETFDRWMAIAQAPTRGTAPGARIEYGPPDFTACVAKQRAISPKPAKGQPKPTDATFKTTCKMEYEQFRDQALQFLISEKWIRKESEDQGIELSKADLDKEFATVRKSFPKEADFQKRLKEAGLTEADARLQVQFEAYSKRLKDKVTKDTDKVTNTDISKYYEKNKSRFAEPEKRDVRMVLTKSKAKADQAKAALESGRSWGSVTKQYSTDAATKAKGGVLEGIPKGSPDQEATFRAAKGELNGPIKTQFGYIVFKVQKIVPAKQQSLKQASAMIKQQLESERQQEVLTDFSEKLRKKWKARTNCREGYVTQDCKNAPKPKTTATQPGQPQPGQPQPGQPQPQQPQQPQQPPQQPQPQPQP